jgi:SRSO17 transposase
VKQPQHITFTGLKTTPTHVASWTFELTHLHRRLASRFARPEPRHRALLYLQGLLSAVECKNGWQPAEQAREATPYGMQRLLSQAVWDTEGVRDDLRSYALEQLGTSGAVVAIDETSFPKRGKHSAGVGVQYCGATGQVQNCQVGVFLSYVTAQGHTLIDRELYLPMEWCEDHERCRTAGIPESVRFQTKPEPAVQMLARWQQAQVPIAWVVADTVYGGNLDLGTWCEQQQYPYVLAVPCDEPVGIVTSDGRCRRVTVAEVEALLLTEQDWQRLSMSEGTKGPRLFDWAAAPILHRWQDDGRHWLLLRRCLSAEQQQTYYFVSAAPGTTLLQMVQACGARWHIEENFENGKDLGLGHYEVRSYLGWYRHMTLVMLTQAFLTGICIQPLVLAAPTADSGTSLIIPLLSLTTPEVRHVLARLIWPPPSSARLVLAWSWWRRSHRSRACYFHTRRRLEAG